MNTWVCPLWNNADPCRVLNMSTSQLIFLSEVKSRPSHLCDKKHCHRRQNFLIKNIWHLLIWIMRDLCNTMQAFLLLGEQNYDFWPYLLTTLDLDTSGVMTYLLFYLCTTKQQRNDQAHVPLGSTYVAPIWMQHAKKQLSRGRSSRNLLIHCVHKGNRFIRIISPHRTFQSILIRWRSPSTFHVSIWVGRNVGEGLSVAGLPGYCFVSFATLLSDLWCDLPWAFFKDGNVG